MRKLPEMFFGTDFVCLSFRTFIFKMPSYPIIHLVHYELCYEKYINPEIISLLDLEFRNEKLDFSFHFVRTRAVVENFSDSSIFLILKYF